MHKIGISKIDKNDTEIKRTRKKKKPVCTFALVIGHSQKSQGACNALTGVTEFHFNEKLVKLIEEDFKDSDIKIEVVYRKSYRALPDDVNKLKPDYVISFHSNAFNGKVSGSETLYYYTSEIGKALAQNMQDAMVGALNLPDRGIKPKRTDSRGGYLLRYTDAPCVILEPFFIDNDKDFAHAAQNILVLKDALVDTINVQAKKS